MLSAPPVRRKRSSSLPTSEAMPVTRLLCSNLWVDEHSPETMNGFLSPKQMAEKVHSSSHVMHGDIGPKQLKRAISVPYTTYFRVSDVGLRDSGQWTKDARRRCHALNELLATEVGYLADLRFLVTVYLRNLPTLVVRSLSSTSTFGRASAPFTTGPSWMHSSSSSVSSFSGAFAESHNITASSTSTKDSTNLKSSNSRFIFTDREIELLMRNAEEILQLHENFMTELRVLLEPLGFSMEHDGDLVAFDPPKIGRESGALHVQLQNLNEAIRLVSTKFATESSRFNAYQTFCAGHPEAANVLRKAFQQFPLELEAFEQKCSSIICDMLKSDIQAPDSECTHKLALDSIDRSLECLAVDAIAPPLGEDRKRALSLTSLDGRKVSKSKSSLYSQSLRPRASMTAVTVISMMSCSQEGGKEAYLVSPSSAPPPKLPLPAADTGTVDATAGTKKGRQRGGSSSRGRIAMTDYLIKPVQRICKYPLLLDQLLPSKTQLRLAPRKSPAAIDVVVESATQAMRHVASSVDKAKERQSIAIQSSLIYSRICRGLQAQGMLLLPFSHSYSFHSATTPSPNSSSALQELSQGQTQISQQPRLITPTFLSSLGPCFLSGSLDVIHYTHPLSARTMGTKMKTKIKAKYLGAFLYAGGYLILVKVSKGRRYEPKHWFSLSGWGMVDVDDEDSMLPNTFRLSTADHHFELAAACLREKDIWLTSIREALRHVAAWVLEPLPSFMCDGGGNFSTLLLSATTAPPSSSASEDGYEAVELSSMMERTTANFGECGGLATIRSIPDICDINVSEVESTQTHVEPPVAKVGQKRQKSNDKVVLLFGQHLQHHQTQKLRNDDVHVPPPSRQSSSTSVKSIFSPVNTFASDREKDKDKEKENGTVLVTRSSAAARQVVDIELQDIISATCLSARAKTAWKERREMVWGSSKTKMNSGGIGSVGRGMARLSKHESVRVARKRTAAVLATEGLKCVSEVMTPSSTSSTSNARSGGRKNLSLSSISFDEDSLLLQESAPPVTAISSSDYSSPPSPPHPSSDVTSNIAPSNTPFATPISGTSSSTTHESTIRTKHRSFVRNVKGLFHFRPVFPSATSPISVIVSQPSQSSVASIEQTNIANSNANYSGHGLLHLFSKEPHRQLTKCHPNRDISVPSFREDEALAKENFSIVAPVIEAAMPIMIQKDHS